MAESPNPPLSGNKYPLPKPNLGDQSKSCGVSNGGGGQVFAKTTNPAVSTGDGIAIAWRAGAMVRDLEFFQFHPTALMKPGVPHFLISEAVRGEGAHLVDREGRRFAFDYHPLEN
ncbi:L-aspartate oxidase (plasmid) [Planktothrix agardhii]|nr:L-aspartate oxidase [Planktothrix agardhii]